MNNGTSYTNFAHINGKMEKAQDYLKLNNKYLKEAEALISKGDYVQASEKFWGAAAARKSIELKSHGELYGFVSKLKDELHESELARLFSLASTLHQNFYENWLPAETVKDHAEAVRKFVERLKKETG